MLQALDTAAHALRNQADTVTSARAPDATADSSAEESRSTPDDELNGADDSPAEDTEPQPAPNSSAEDSVFHAALARPRTRGQCCRGATASQPSRCAGGNGRNDAGPRPGARDGGERYQAVVLVDADVLGGAAEGRCHIEDGPALAAALSTWRAVRVRPRDQLSATSIGDRPFRLVGSLAAMGLPVAAVTGVRMAVTPGRASGSAPIRNAALVSTIICISAIAVVATFDTSLQRLLSTPPRYGWNWDVVVGCPFSSDTADQTVPILTGADSVVGVSSSSSGPRRCVTSGLRSARW